MARAIFTAPKLGMNFCNIFFGLQTPTLSSSAVSVSSLSWYTHRFCSSSSKNDSGSSNALSTKVNRQTLSREELVEKIPELIFQPRNNGPFTDSIICWHPAIPVPYELTKPIPTELSPADNNLHIQALTPVREVFRKKHERLIVRELMHLTYTTKHQWFGRYGKRKRKAFGEMNPLNEKRDREYL